MVDVSDSGLRAAITASLMSQGFSIGDNQRLLIPGIDKALIRRLHSTAIEHKRENAKVRMARYESRLLGRFASGAQVDVGNITPRLVEVLPKSENELLFRYAKLHWSIPVSAGYGRRLRFLIIDDHNNKLMGLIGVGDPVFNLKPRDEWIGWNKTAARQRLRYVMDLFVLGAVPPYSFLFGGKLVALLATSNEVRTIFERKYAGRNALISHTQHNGTLALLTTTSALGLSSIYNRLTFKIVSYPCLLGQPADMANSSFRTDCIQLFPLTLLRISTHRPNMTLGDLAFATVKNLLEKY